MKFSIKIFLLLAFVLTELSLSFAKAIPIEADCTTSTPNYLMKPKIKISFIIARHRDCDGFGICDWNVGSVGRTQNKGNGVLYQDDASRNTLVLEISKTDGITDECYNKYFKTGVYTMEDDFPIPSEISKSLEYPGIKTIPAGKHRIVEINGLIYVYFPVK